MRRRNHGKHSVSSNIGAKFKFTTFIDGCVSISVCSTCLKTGRHSGRHCLHAAKRRRKTCRSWPTQIEFAASRRYSSALNSAAWRARWRARGNKPPECCCLDCFGKSLQCEPSYARSSRASKARRHRCSTVPGRCPSAASGSASGLRHAVPPLRTVGAASRWGCSPRAPASPARCWGWASAPWQRGSESLGQPAEPVASSPARRRGLRL